MRFAGVVSEGASEMFTGVQRDAGGMRSRSTTCAWCERHSGRRRHVATSHTVRNAASARCESTTRCRVFSSRVASRLVTAIVVASNRQVGAAQHRLEASPQSRRTKRRAHQTGNDHEAERIYSEETTRLERRSATGPSCIKARPSLLEAAALRRRPGANGFVALHDLASRTPRRVPKAHPSVSECCRVAGG